MRNNSQAMKIVSMLRKLADLIEQNPEVARMLSLDLVQPESDSSSKRAVVPSFDVFEVYRSNGETDLISKLKDCTLEELINIVRSHGLDTTGKVRKWKTPEKIISFIVERVSAKISKGTVFDS